MSAADSHSDIEPDAGDSGSGGTQRSILIAVAVAIVAAAIASGVTAQVTSNQGALEDRDNQLAELRAQASAHAATVGELRAAASDQAAVIDGLNAQVTALTERAEADAAQMEQIQAEKLALQEQVDQLLNPPLGPAPTATLKAFWVRRVSSFVAACVELTNTSDADIDLYFSSGQFSAVDRDAFVYPSLFVGPGYGINLTTPLRDGSLGPGERRRGELEFEVLVGHPLTELTWENGATSPPAITIDLPRPDVRYRRGEC